jgi:hypothetical protein
VLIVVDQFEELYTLAADEEAPRRFLDELLAISLRDGSKASVALTVRGDFVGRALAYRPLSDRLQDAQINLGPMTRKELESAIREPAEKIQLEFESGLVLRILDAVGDEPGNLPLLEFALKELWENRRGQLLLNETYDAMGQLKGALAKKAGDFFGKLSSADQKILQRIFLRIVRPSESGEDTRRRARFTELPAGGAELVVKLANERLLVTNESAGRQTFEIAHEALISNWDTLRSWVNEDREFLLWRERLGTLLTEWTRAEGSVETLLRGPLLIEAQKWFDRRSQDLSDQERKFIYASRELRERLAREERERQEREVEVVRKLVGAQRERAEVAEKREQEQKEAAQKLEEAAQKLRVERAAAEEQGRIAQAAAETAQHALTNSFFRTIGVSNQDVLPLDEREALWELAQLDRVNAPVRSNLLKRWFGTAEAYMRGEARGGQGFRALTGLNLDYQRFAIKGAARLGRHLVAAFEDPQGIDSDRLSSLGSALAALAAKMEPEAAAEIGSRGARCLVVALKNPKETDSANLSSIGSALAALAAKMEPQVAAEIANDLAAAFRNPQETGSARLSSLSSALVALAAKIEPQAAAEIANDLAAALKDPQERYRDHLLSLSDALGALAAKMEPQAAGEIAKDLAAVLEDPQERDSTLLSSLSSALVALAAKMEPQAAAEIAKDLAAVLEKEMYFNRLLSVNSAVEALAAKMEPQAAAEIAKDLAAALEKEWDFSCLSSLGSALAALAAKMEPQAAAKIARRGAQRLVTALESLEETDFSCLSSLGSALAALAAKMEPRVAAKIVRRGAQCLAAVLENPPEGFSGHVASLSSALAALADKMEPQAAAEIAMPGAQRLAAALKNPQETDSARLSSLGKTLAALCSLLPSAHHTHLLALSNMLLQPVSKEATEGKEQPYDRKLLAAVCAQLRTEDLVEVLKYPLCTGETEQIVLNHLKATAGRKFGGYVWKFVEQADSLGIKDISSPAQRPSAQDALNELGKL